jgi:hypothetical protein
VIGPSRSRVISAEAKGMGASRLALFLFLHERAGFAALKSRWSRRT